MLRRESALAIFVFILLYGCTQGFAIQTAWAEMTVKSREQEFGVVVPYDIVYIRAPRYGDTTLTKIPEVGDPIGVEPGSDLMLLHPDGTEEVLVEAGDGAVLDPAVSFDGQWVFYAKVHDQTKVNTHRKNAAYSGSDIFKIHLASREVTQLTFQEWTPNLGVADWSDNPVTAYPPGSNYLGYGVYNLGPCPLPDGKIMFTSSRNGFLPNKSFTFPNLQLFVMDQDGKNIEFIGPLSLGSALHPTVLMDGRVMFSSYEAQGVRDRRLWGLWFIWPDGRQWGPLMSALKTPSAFHWQAQLSDGSIVIEEYYNKNNNGFGAFLKFPVTVPQGTLAFGQPDPKHKSNPAIQLGWQKNGNVRTSRYPFSPYGLESLTPFTIENDRAAPFLNGTGSHRTGKVSQPSAAPNNDLLLVWTPGPANNQNRPTNLPVYDAGLYLLPKGLPVNDPQKLVLIKNDPAYNEQQPHAVVRYREIYGIDEPKTLPWLPNDGLTHAQLPEGTPYGLIGTSTFYRRNSKPGVGEPTYNGLDPFYSSKSAKSTNWFSQGADAGYYENDEIYAVRIVTLEPTSHVSYGPNNNEGGNRKFFNHANERMRILGEIPLRKYDSHGNLIVDPDGNPDTSFLAKIPADVPFTFQTIDKDGLLLNASQTWHQVRPGEVRHDCGGCHAHAEHPLDFSVTAAAKSDYQIFDLANTTPFLTKDVNHQPVINTLSQGAMDVEYYRDIKPILQRSCVGCHSKEGTHAAGLVLDDDDIVKGFDNTYHRLANDPKAQYGIPPLHVRKKKGGWGEINGSRYIRKFQSRRSLLMWKIFGRRLDGWSNEAHPTPSVPGDSSTLPMGGQKGEIKLSDIDYTGATMPPPQSGVPPLSEDEKMLFARWVDLGCPINRNDEHGEDDKGWFLDELRPTLTLSSPRAGKLPGPLSMIRIGAFDYYSGLDLDSLSVITNFGVNGHAPGEELASLLRSSKDHIWTVALMDPITNLTNGEISVSIKDRQGNISIIKRTFHVSP